MASLMTLPTEIRLRIWRYVVSYEVEVSWDEFVGRSQLDFLPDGEPLMVHPVAYASTTASGIRLLCRQAYADFQDIKPSPTYCPIMLFSELHKKLGDTSDIFVSSLCRIKIIEPGQTDPTNCVKRHLPNFVLTGRSTSSEDLPKACKEWLVFKKSEVHPPTTAESRLYGSRNTLGCCTRIRGPRSCGYSEVCLLMAPQEATQLVQRPEFSRKHRESYSKPQ